MTSPDQTKKDRIFSELTDAKVTAYGLRKQESRYLPNVILANEKIMAVVYGLYNDGTKLPASGMMIATDRRLLFVDKKPLFVIKTDISYDVLSGVSVDYVGRFASVVTHTKQKDYKFNFVNRGCAKHYVSYLENDRLSISSNSQHFGI